MSTDVQTQSNNAKNYDFGIRTLERILSPTLKANTVLTIAGERNTYKGALARHYLLHGLIKKKESALLIRLHEQPSMDRADAENWLLADDLFPVSRGKMKIVSSDFCELRPWLTSGKLIQRCYVYQPGDGTDNSRVGHKRSGSDQNAPRFYELALKGGAILPEEFIQYVRNVLRDASQKRPIKRVVLDDVAQIGVSYPYLRQSPNAGNLALAAFVHVMRNLEVGLVMVGTRTGLAQSDEMVDRACTLADEVLTCEYCDVFGDRYIVAQGGGMAAGDEARGQKDEVQEIVPAVLIPRPVDHRFSVDSEMLAGLVGFGTKNIHRPGVTFRTFKENGRIHGKYNDELRELISTTLGTRQENDRRASAESVEIVEFDPDHTQAYHDGLLLMSGKPIHRTIIATVDEFFERVPSSDEPPKGTVFAGLKNVRIDEYIEPIKKQLVNVQGRVPYYANVLCLFYNTTKFGRRPAWLELETKGRPPRLKTWKGLADHVRKLEGAGKTVGFAYDLGAKETGACLLMGALTSTKSWSRFCKEPVKGIINNQSEMNALRFLVAKNPRSDELPLGADVYVCWYSQFRELIKRAEEQETKKPETEKSKTEKLEIDWARNLGVCALPNGGFSGTWFMGVVNGSVSVDLGCRLIDCLNSSTEQYKRLQSGVGLPPSEKFYSKAFSAWPGSKVKMSTLKLIHENAKSRAAITDYPQIRTVFYDAWRELGIDQEDLVSSTNALKGLKERLSVLVKPSAKKSGTCQEPSS